MTDDEVRGAEAYVRLVHLIADSAFDATDEEIAEEMSELGEDVEENAERLRAVMLDVVRRHRERKRSRPARQPPGARKAGPGRKVRVSRRGRKVR